MMNRRQFLGSTPMLTDALLQAVQPITHVDVSQNGALLKSSVVKGKELQPEGNSPGAKARVHFNGPTAQLAAVAAGVCTLEPGAQPHPPHRHPEEEFMIVAIGIGEIEVAGVVTQVEAGDIMFAEANVLHGIRNTGQTMMTFYFTKILGKHV